LKDAGYTTLRLYDALGREVQNLVESQQAAGRYRVTLDASEMATGIYFYRLESGDFVATHKMLLVK
jgi:hypothetical protein